MFVARWFMLQYSLSYQEFGMRPYIARHTATHGVAWVLSFILPLLLTGCGGGGVEKLPLYPAGGTVQMDGKAFGPVSLRFEPEEDGGRGFVATVDANGKINAVTTYKVGDGAPKGTYKVTVFSSMGASKPFPSKYENASTTPLKVIIADITGEGANAMDIQLDSKAGPASKNSTFGHFTPEQLDTAAAAVEN